MASPAWKPASYDDVLAAPAHRVAEIVGGELHTSPRPASRHALASTALGQELGPPFHRGRGGPGGWWLLDEPELHLDADILVPDIAGWRRERMPDFPDCPFFSLVPDWVCEVISPSTERFDRVDKLPVYARAGVEFVWLVNPNSRTLEVLRREGGAWRLLSTHGDDDIVRAAPFDAIDLDLLALWGEERPPAP